MAFIRSLENAKMKRAGNQCVFMPRCDHEVYHTAHTGNHLVFALNSPRFPALCPQTFNIFLPPWMHRTTGDNPPLFPSSFYTAPLNTWAASIQRDPLWASQCLLEQVVHYKALSSLEHEFLVIYAIHHPSGFKTVLGVDRSAQDVATPVVSPDTAQPSVLTSSARYLNKLMSAKSSPSSASASSCPSSEESPHIEYDGVQVSHDGTPAPILALNGPSILLSTITFPHITTCSSDAEHPSLLHLSFLLLTIRKIFPSYILLQYQCYFFARTICVALMDIFGGVETGLEEGRRAATWRGVHVSLYSVGLTGLRNMPLDLLDTVSKAESPSIIRFAGLFAVAWAVKLYDVVRSEKHRRNR